MSKPSHVVVTGMGYWGKNLVRNFHGLGALYGVCDPNPDVKDVCAGQYPGVKYSADYDEVLADPGVRGVALATPAAMHADMTERALRAGKDVFVEKPLALNVDEGERLVATAREFGRVLMVGHILQYHPAVLKLKALVEAGELGKLQYIYSNRLNMGKIRTEENILWSFAPHDISVMLALVGEMPNFVACHGEAFLSQRVHDITMSQFRFPCGVHAHIYVSWLHPFKEQRLVVVGSEKMAVFDDTADEKLVLYPHRVVWDGKVPTAVKADAEPVPLEAGEPLRAECAAFLEAIETRKPPATDGAEGQRVLRVLDSCQRALTGDKDSP